MGTIVVRRWTSSRSRYPGGKLSRIWISCCLLNVATLTLATPTSYFPINSQLPPVARVAEPFSFVFSPITFSSDTDIKYSLAKGSPSWLSLDSSSRRFSGIPDEKSVPEGDDLVGTHVQLVAADETGSTTANVTLVVSRSSGPAVRIPLEDQIDNFGPFSAPASILQYPSKEFEFAFDRNTFGLGALGENPVPRPRIRERDNDKIESGVSIGTPSPVFNYYAVSGDNAPLPSWVKFSAETLSFSGKTPPFESLIQPPQTFDFRLVASDVVGFSSVSVDFSIVVGTHELTVDEAVVEINATRGAKFSYSDLPNILRFDKESLTLDDIYSITAQNLPKWASFDEKTWELSGTPDSAAKPVNITIAVVDKISDTLNVTLSIQFTEDLFVSDIPSMSVIAGDEFSFDLKRYLFDPQNTRIATKTEPNDSWLHIDDSDVLSGTIPQPLSAGYADEIRVTLVATQKRTNEQATKYLRLQVKVPAITSAPEPTMTSALVPGTEGGGSGKNMLGLLALAFLPLLIALIILLLWFRKRRQQRPKKLDSTDISAPDPGSFMVSSSTDGSLQDMRRMLDIGPASVQSVPSQPSNPRVSETTWNPSTESDNLAPPARAMHSGATRPGQNGQTILENRKSRLADRRSRLSPLNTDEMSLLSDTSIEEGQSVIIIDTLSHHPSHTSNTTFRYGGQKLLDVPISSEPFSIQATPELAYTAGRDYNYVSDDELPPSAGYAASRRSTHKNNNGGLRDRLSKAWKRGSVSRLVDELKRNSHLSTSTDLTTRTSILTSGFTEEATTTSTHIAKPTVIHIASRPGEARQVSRRTEDSATFFGSGTKSQRNFGLQNSAPEMPSPSSFDSPLPVHGVGFAVSDERARESDTSWDRIARNSLGIAYKDLVCADTRHPVRVSENWETHHTSQDLMSPSKWPLPTPKSTKAQILSGVAYSTDLRSKSEPPQSHYLPSYQDIHIDLDSDSDLHVAPLATPKDKGKRKISSSSNPQTSHRRTSGEEQFRLSRLREAQALAEFKAMMSGPPSPSADAPPTWILPETPTPAGRAPLGERGDNGLRSAISKRSAKSVGGKSMKSVKSAGGSAWEDDDDAWEDIRPPESTVGGWEHDGSEGSFSVYI
ncbi:hypothetical protein F5Y18DRAFT_20773 [Xylariaceae sp. FL1019]|nr:hypothetical protein F5Y18DRAFT_20773 [Xylariaceae sp. FL1019]